VGVPDPFLYVFSSLAKHRSRGCTTTSHSYKNIEIYMKSGIFMVALKKQPRQKRAELSTTRYACVQVLSGNRDGSIDFFPMLLTARFSGAILALSGENCGENSSPERLCGS
jgi:hypothetical protein